MACAGKEGEGPTRGLRLRFKDPGYAPEGNDTDEGLGDEEEEDEELCAMANVRRRRKLPTAKSGLPKLKLRAGANNIQTSTKGAGSQGDLQTVPSISGPLKLRLKLSGASKQAAEASAGAGDRAALQRRRTQHQLNSDDEDDGKDVGGKVPQKNEPGPDQPTPARAASLKLRWKNGAGESTIPQVDGAADEEEIDDLEARREGVQEQLENAVTSIDPGGAATGSVEAGPLIAQQQPPPLNAAGDLTSLGEAEQRPSSVQAQIPQGTCKLASRSSVEAGEPSCKAIMEPEKPNKAASVGEGEMRREGAAAHQEQQGLNGAMYPAAEDHSDHEILSPAAAIPDQPLEAGLPGVGSEHAHPLSASAEHEAEAETAAGAKLRGEAAEKQANALSKKETEGIAALLHGLRRWLKDIGGIAAVPSDLNDPEVNF